MKKILLVAVLATFALNVFAQGGERGPFLTNRAFDNWFISAGGGVNMYFGESDKTAKFGKRISPALDVSIGKWFTPSIGARLQYAGLSAKGASPYAGAPYVTTGPMTAKGTYPEKFGVNFIHADFLWNISSAIGGYKQTRRWEFIPYAGFGAAIASSVKNRDKKHELAFAAGLINKIRITRALDINIELRGMLVNQRFDGVVGGKKGEGMGSVTAGLTYKFNKRGFEKYHKVAPADYTPYNNRIAALEKDLTGANAKIAQLNKDLTAARNVKPAEAVTQYVFPDMAIFFPIGKATLSKKEQVNIAYIAEAIKKMPAGHKVILDGNADSVTGTKKGNMTLSEKRIKAVYDALVAAGVKPAQLELVAHGDTKEPFGHDKPALNRVLIIEH